MIPGSATDPDAAIHNGINILLANGVTTFLANGKPTFKQGPSLPGNTHDSMILDICVFDNFTLIAKLFAKPYEY